MVMIGRGDEHRVDLLVHGVEHSPVIRERPRLRALRGSLLGGGSQALVVHIHDSDQVLRQRTVQAHLASPAATRGRASSSASPWSPSQRSSCGTTGWALTPLTPASYSASSNACTARATFRAQALGWPQ